MKEYFVQMNEDYQNKYYPNGFFNSLEDVRKKQNTMVYILFGFFFVVFTPVALFGIKLIISGIQDGEQSGITAGVIMAVVGILFGVGPFALFFLIRSRQAKSGDGWIAQSVQSSEYPEQDILKFEQQVVASDTIILQMKGKNKTMQPAGHGVLTRDFIYLSNTKVLVMKRSDVASAYLVDVIEMMQNYKNEHVLYLLLISKNGSYVRKEVDEEAARKLVAMLLETNPTIDTKDGAIIPEKEMFKISKSYALEHANSEAK